MTETKQTTNGQPDFIIAANIERILAAQGKSWYWLMHNGPVHSNTADRIKKGKWNIDGIVLKRICLALKVQPGDIVTLPVE